MYKVSNYITSIIDEVTNKRVIYSLRTARFAELDEDVYNDIIINNCFIDKYSNLLLELLEKKIIIHKDEDELVELNNARYAKLEQDNNSATTHYIITPTMECNARCYYCFEHGAHHKTMTTELADDVVDYMIKESQGQPISIYWYGGEPLMGTDLIDRMTDKLSSSGIEFSSRITSNGYYLTEENIDKSINRWNVEMIQIPIDDIGEAYNKIKNYKSPRVDDPFSLVLNNVENALNAGIKIRIRINFHPLQMSSIERISSFICERFNNHPNLMFHFKPIGADNIPWMTELPWEGENSLKTYYELSDRYVKHRVKAPVTDKIKINNKKFKKTCTLCHYTSCVKREDEVGKILRDYDLLPISINCGGITNRAIAIDSCGSLYNCHLMLGQDPEQYAGGTIYTGLTGDGALGKCDAASITEPCTKCKLLPLCQGGCKFREYRYSPKENRCIIYKYHLQELIEEVVRKLHQANLPID